MNGGADGTRNRKVCIAQNGIAHRPHSHWIRERHSTPLPTKLGAKWVQPNPKPYNAILGAADLIRQRHSRASGVIRGTTGMEVQG